MAFSGIEEEGQAVAWLARYDWEVMVAISCMFDLPEGAEPPRATAADGDITAAECFALLTQYCQVGEAEAPSFTIFTSMVKFLFPQFEYLRGWSLVNATTVQEFTENNFKHSFMRLLIATTKDFATRSVPQGNQARLPDDDQPGADAGQELGARQSSAPRLPRTNSRESGSELADAAHALAEGAIDGGPPPAVPLTRQRSREDAHRFDSMIGWESTDHPIAVFNVRCVDRRRFRTEIATCYVIRIMIRIT